MARVVLPRIFIFLFILVLLLFGIGLVFGPLGSSFFGNEPPDLLKVSKPHVILPAETVFHVGHFPVTNTLIASWLTMAVLVGASYLATRKMKLIPGRAQAMAEAVVEGLLNFVESVAGKRHARMLLPGVATIFIYVITNAYMGLLPFFGTIGFIEHEGRIAFPLQGSQYRHQSASLHRHHVPLSLSNRGE